MQECNVLLFKENYFISPDVFWDTETVYFFSPCRQRDFNTTGIKGIFRKALKIKFILFPCF
jgi:hypothetical protein